MNDKREQIEGFTPGPWSVGRFAPDGDRSLDLWAVTVCHGSYENQGNCVAVAYNGVVSGQAAALANARLIALAPTLYAENESLRAELQKTKSDALTMVDAADRHFATAQKLHSEVTRLESDASELRAEVARLRDIVDGVTVVIGALHKELAARAA